MAMYLPLKRSQCRMSSGFGWRTHPITGKKHLHAGMDFAAPHGTPIYAPFDGVCIEGADRAEGSVGGFWNWVRIRNDKFEFVVGHMPHWSITVRAGDRVKAGQQIAVVGSEGDSTGPHAHCEIHKGQFRNPIDPSPYWDGTAPSPGEPLKGDPTVSTGFDYYTLEPHEIYLLGKHYTPGRAGAKIEFVTRHHLMYQGDVRQVVDKIWNTREASAHIVIDPVGEVGQAVWDSNTAWANANQWANRRTLAIEHSNNTGRVNGNDYDPRSWNISDETIIAGARWAAAVLVHEKLGPPVYGKNIRDHGEFSATGCPVHLWGPHPKNPWGGKPGKYHGPWMEEAKAFYDLLDKKLVAPDGSPLSGKFPPPKPKEVTTVSTPIAWPDGPGALDEAKLAATEARDILTAKSPSLINKSKRYSMTDLLRLIDAQTWEQRKLLEALCRKQGLDPEQIVADAKARDNKEVR